VSRIIGRTRHLCTAAPRGSLLGTLLLSLVLAQGAEAEAFPLLPQPLFEERSDANYALGPDTSVQLPADAAVQESASWVFGLINEATGLSLKATSVEALAHGPAPTSGAGMKQAAGRAVLALELVDETLLSESFAVAGLTPPRYPAEAYDLHINGQGVLLRASTSAGLQHGLSTLWQLALSAPASNGQLLLPQLRVLDAPQFSWRGLMLDSARHMQSVDHILQQLDWMALHKLNSFHWHLTDDQGWRLEIEAFPKLTEVGAYRVPAGQAPAADIDPATGEPRLYGGFFTQDEVRRIVAHATRRHINVVPEINVPGHGSAAIVAYPELGVEGYQPDQVPADWGIYHNVFNLEESTFRFFEQVLDEVVELFPGPFVHLGGDEVVTEQWEDSARVQERMAALGIDELQGVQNYFVERLQRHLDQYERRVIGWDEVLESELPPHAVVMSWRGVDGAIEAAAKQHQTVLSPAPTLYLDHIQTTAADAPPGRGGVMSIREVYEFDPLPERLADNREQVLGVQANLWTEHVRGDARAVYQTWPRAIALAEVAWTPPARRDFEAFRARLHDHLPRLDALGMAYANDVQSLSGDPGPGPQEPLLREDRELELCSGAIVLALEDDAPLAGARESYLVDIMNPCWIWRDAPLAGVVGISASVGQLPFNFQIGDLREQVKTTPPATPAGELIVQLDDCAGPVIAALSLAPAMNNPAATVLPQVPIDRTLASGDRLSTAGTADLCLRFRSDGFDPFWVLDWVRLEAES